jgi:hypothetical protein
MSEMPKDELPNGYLQAVSTAITIFVSFSLLLMREWGAGGGPWTDPSRACAKIVAVCTFVQIGLLGCALLVKPSQRLFYVVIVLVFLSTALTTFLTVFQFMYRTFDM